MSRLINCPPCNKRMKELADKYGEYYTSIEGKAIKDMLCDSCGDKTDIKVGDTCFAACLLPSENHFNSGNQAPVMWAKDFITV